MAVTVEQKYISFALELADVARKTLLDNYRPDCRHSVKSDGSPVTELDKMIERNLRIKIEKRFPEHGIFGEEYGTKGTDREFVWSLDPIDGTKNLAAGLPDFGSLIALCRNGYPIVGIVDIPLQKQRLVGALGQDTTINGDVVRCRVNTSISECVMITSGLEAFEPGADFDAYDRLRKRTAWNTCSGGCISYLSLSRGAVDIVMEGNLDPFDFCAVVPAIEGAGGFISDWQGSSLHLGSGPQILCTSNQHLHEEILTVLQSV